MAGLSAADSTPTTPAPAPPDLSKLPPLPAHPPAVVLKLDDLSAGSSGNVPPNWKRLSDFAIERKIKVSLGIIAETLGTAKPAYVDYLKDLQKTGLFEFWFHGWDHKEWEEGGQPLYEFKGPPYAQQKEHFVKAQALLKEKLGVNFTVFGAPFNAFDDITFKVFGEDRDMEVFLYATPADQPKIPGKVILDRLFDVNIENPLFVPNPDKFIAGYLKHAQERRYYVIQGHANHWDDARWAEFVKIVDFLQQNHIPIITATEAAALP
jgi:hypothetical protein